MELLIQNIHILHCTHSVSLVCYNFPFLLSKDTIIEILDFIDNLKNNIFITKDDRLINFLWNPQMMENRFYIVHFVVMAFRS